MKKQIIISMFFMTTSLISQTSRIDSLKSVTRESHPKKRSIAFSMLSDEYQHFNMDSALFYGKESIKYSEQTGEVNFHVRVLVSYCEKLIKLGDYDKVIRKVESFLVNPRVNANNKGTLYRILGTCHFNKSNYDIAMGMYNHAGEIYTSNDNLKDLMVIKGNIALVYAEKGNNKRAKQIYDECIEWYQKIGNDRNLSNVYTNMGLLLFEEAAYDESLNYHKKALRIDSVRGDKYGMSIGLNNIAIVLNNKGQNKLATDYFFKALEINEELGFKEEVATNYNNIAFLYNLEGDSENSIKYFKKAVAINKLIGNKRGLGINYVSIASLFEHNLDSAMYYVTKGERIFLETKDYPYLAPTYDDRGEIYFRMSKPNMAELYFSKSISILDTIPNVKYKAESLLNLSLSILEQGNSRPSYLKEELIQKYGNSPDILLKNAHNLCFSSNNLESVIIFYETAIEILYKQKKYEKVIDYMKSLKVIKDSLYTVEKFSSIKEVETKYQTEKKEKENLQLKQTNTQQELTIAKENQKNWILGSGLGGSILVLGILFISYKRNQKQKKKIEFLQRELHHRVKNNLTFVDSFIEVAKEEFENTTFESKLLELQDRIESIGKIHKQLHKSKDVTQLNLKEYLSELIANIRRSFSQKQNIMIHLNISEGTTISADKSFSIGLIVNEFVTNSFKYAFDQHEGEINIEFEKKEGDYVLILSDNGKGLPEGFSVENTSTFGMRIVELLVKQENGEVQIESNEGVQIEIQLPKK